LSRVGTLLARSTDTSREPRVNIALAIHTTMTQFGTYLSSVPNFMLSFFRDLREF
jgi:hypothetical protein